MKLLFGFSVISFLLVATLSQAHGQDTFFDPKRDEVVTRGKGFCTRLSCPPGTRVEVVAVPGDAGIALTWDGQVVDLLNLTGMKLVVMSFDIHSSSAWVLSPCNIAYNIKFMFLRKMPSERRVSEKQQAGSDVNRAGIVLAPIVAMEPEVITMMTAKN